MCLCAVNRCLLRVPADCVVYELVASTQQLIVRNAQLGLYLARKLQGFKPLPDTHCLVCCCPLRTLLIWFAGDAQAD